MKKQISSGRLTLRFTLIFILHQILLSCAISLPAIFYIVVLKQPQEPAAISLTIGVIFLVYLLYCLFYGAVVARPMADILAKNRTLAQGDFLTPAKETRLAASSRHLYREVYANLDALSEG